MSRSIFCVAQKDGRVKVVVRLFDAAFLRNELPGTAMNVVLLASQVIFGGCARLNLRVARVSAAMH